MSTAGYGIEVIDATAMWLWPLGVIPRYMVKRQAVVTRMFDSFRSATHIYKAVDSDTVFLMDVSLIRGITVQSSVTMRFTSGTNRRWYPVFGLPFETYAERAW